MSKLNVRYSTIFDRNFIARAICLYESWAQHVSAGEFAFYCMDSESMKVLKALALPHAVVVPHDEFASPALQAARSMRSVGEYCWTSKPAVIQHAFDNRPGLDWAVYLDSDMMFFGDGDDALRAAASANFLLTPHRFSPDFESFRASVGDYNAGYAAFRNTIAGREAVAWWLARCLESCDALPVEGRYADQKYLDKIPALCFGWNAEVKGLNTAPWNVNNYQVTVRKGRIFVDDEPLLLFHYQGLRIHGRSLYDMYCGNMKLKRAVTESIYRPYVRRLARAIDQVRRAGGRRGWGIESPLRNPRLLYRHGRRALLGINNLVLATD